MKLTQRQIDFIQNAAELQAELVPLVQELYKKGEICFSSVLAHGDPYGNYWIPNEKIEGEYLYHKFESDSDGVIELSKKIGNDYQKVIAAYFEKYPERKVDLVEDGKRWTMGKLLMWGGSIVEAGLLERKDIEKLAGEFEKVIAEKGEEFFSYVHGNVIGDHVYIGSDGIPYLLGMRIVPRPGRGYYDLLRTLDWLILKTDKESMMINDMTKYLSEYNKKEVDLVFALRAMGILGWDMLHRGDLGRGDVEHRKKYLLKIILKEY